MAVCNIDCVLNLEWFILFYIYIFYHTIVVGCDKLGWMDPVGLHFGPM